MEFSIREVQPIFDFIMLSLCQAIQCQVVGWLSESHYDQFPFRICLYRLGKPHFKKKKKKVRVVCILAEIKTGHLSNMFQTEITPWSPTPGILTTMPLHKPKWTWSRSLDWRRFETVTMSVIQHYSNRPRATWTTCNTDQMTWRITDETVSEIQIFSVRHGNNWKTDQTYTVTNGVHTQL
jgi:hypothetical protein